MSRFAFSCVLLFLITAAHGSTLCAQERDPAGEDGRPSKALLEDIRNKGRWLASFDIVCDRADRVLKKNVPNAAPARRCIALRKEGGRWVVAYGHLTEDQSAFQLEHAVLLNADREVRRVKTFSSSDSDEGYYEEGYYLQAARAVAVAHEDFQGKKDQPYEAFVIPFFGSDATLTVYLVPASTTAETYPLGGDVRYEIEAATGAIVSKTRLHNRVLDMKVPAQARRSGKGTSVHTAVLTEHPVETDVFFTIRRRPRLPHLVVTQKRVYGIDTSGQITLLREREPESN